MAWSWACNDHMLFSNQTNVFLCVLYKSGVGKVAVPRGLEVGSDSVRLQQVVQDLWGERWVRAGGGGGWGHVEGQGGGRLTMSGVVPIFLASSPRSMVLRYR